MVRHGKIRWIAAVALAALLSIIAFAVTGTSLAPVVVKLTPALVSVDTTQLAPKTAKAEMDAVWRLADRDTVTAYLPSQTARITVSLPEPRTISRVRVYGASSYQLNVYRDNSGLWEAVPSLSGLSLASLSASSWNTLVPAEPFVTAHLLLEFIPQGNATSGIREIELWGPEDATGQESPSHITLEGLRTPADALAILAKSPAHSLEFTAAPSEISVSESATPLVSMGITQNPALFKRAYLLYDGYNLVRSVSIQRRINGLSWSGGFTLPQPEGAAPSWSSYLEEINPAWLVQGENRIEFSSANGAAAIRGLRLIIETDSGWNSVASVSAPAAYDGDAATAYDIAASPANTTVQVNFERAVQPELIRLHLPGPGSVTAGLQYWNGAAWQEVKPGWQTDFSTMQAGWNEIAVPAPVSTTALRLVFTSTLRVKPGVQVGAINEIRVSAGPAGPVPDSSRIIISYPRDGEYFERTAYIQGFVTPAANASGDAAKVTVETKAGQPAVSDGSFSVSLNKDETRFFVQPDDEAWDPAAQAEYGGKAGATVKVLLNKNSGAVTDPSAKKQSRGDAPFADNREKFTDKVSPGQAKKIKFKGVTLDIPAGAVDQDTDITIIPLTEPDLARLNPGMVNVTFPDAGYRFLPHGLKFKKPIKMSFGYSKQLFAAGQVDDEVNMYFYNDKFLRWEKLNRMKVDPAQSLVESETDHFTDIINSTLVVPEHPQALSFNPNSIKDIKAADPGANINLIEPPKATNMGSAGLSYPIVVPKGRGAYTPALNVSYSSSNANGWMGLGWDIPISKIQVDTRWGVPLYDDGTLVTGTPKETESYLLDGASLAPFAPRPFAVETLEDRSPGDKVFRKRVEGDFQRIIRKNTSPHENDQARAPYYWEVTDKSGVRHIYGQTDQARLADYQNGNIFQWNLEKVIDTNGNVTRFVYETDSDTNGEPFKQLYLKKITYTKRTGDLDTQDGPYTIEFSRSASRPDVIIDGKPGFQVLTRSRLESIEVKYRGSIIRRYVFTYILDAEAAEYHFGKSLLKKIAVRGLDGAQDFYAHEFVYERMPKGSDENAYAGFKPEVKEWTNASSGEGLTQTEDQTTTVSLAFGITPNSQYYPPSYGLQGNKGTGHSSTLGMLLDLNGDGLPDRVHQGGGVELNRLNAARDSGTFTGGSFEGLGLLGYNNQDSFSVGPQASYYLAAANFAYSYNFVNTQELMSDVNGDGFVDHVSLAGGLQVKKNTGSAFGDAVPWNGFVFDNVDFGNQAISDKLQGDFFLTDPVRKWIAPFKGTVRITGAVRKIRTGGKDDDVPGKPGTKASVLAFIYRNNDMTPVWTAEIPAEEPSPYGHDLAYSVEPGDRFYFRVNSVKDIDTDEVSWEPVISYEQVCVTQNGMEQCKAIPAEQYAVKDVNGHSLLRFDAKDDLRLSGHPGNIWGAGAKGTVRLTGNIVKSKTSDNVAYAVKHNGSAVWSGSATADEEGEFSHVITREVMPGDRLTFDIESDTTLEPALVAWRPEIVYETYCVEIPETDPKQYSCGPVECAPDEQGVVQCGVDIPELPPAAKIKEEDLHQYGQPNYPLYYLTPTDLSRFWVAPYDGKVRIRGNVVRTVQRESVPVTTQRALAIARGVNSLVWKQWMPARVVPPADPNEPPIFEEQFPQDVTISVSKGDQIFFDVQSTASPGDPAQFGWTPDITYSEYCFFDAAANRKVCEPVTETLTGTPLDPKITETYCHDYDDNQDGARDRTVCEASTCPRNAGPESGLCQYCRTTTDYTINPPATNQSCQAITCTNDLIEGAKDCSPLSLIYKGRQANQRYEDTRYTDPGEQRSDAEAFAGGYRQWHYGTWNGNKTWDEAKIRRTKSSDKPDPDKFSDPDPAVRQAELEKMPSYWFLYLLPRWQGAKGYAKPVWFGRGENEYIGAEQTNPSRLGANVTGIIAGISGSSVNTVQQSVSENVAYGVSIIVGISYSNGDSRNNLDFMDMNGDRYPDQVSRGSVLFNNGLSGFHSKPVALALGDVRKIHNENTNKTLSFTLPENKPAPKGITVKVTTPGASLGWAEGTSDNQSDLIDVNGDGLPDRVTRGAGGLVVNLNLGYRFGGAITWASSLSAIRLNENRTDTFQASFWGIGGGKSDTVARTSIDLRDVNGDGLVDQVYKNWAASSFTVRLNRGDHFGPPENWEVPSWPGSGLGKNDTVNYLQTESYNVTGGVVIIIPIIPVLPVVYINIAPTVAVSGGEGGSELDLSDINGDGLPDHVLKMEGSGTVYARVNNVEQTNLLKEVRRPLGGKFSIEYERRGNKVDYSRPSQKIDMPNSQWVMRRVYLRNGLGNIYETEFNYGNGYHDRFEREFYGYQWVKETHAPGTAIQRSIIQLFDNQNYYLKNRVQKTITIGDQNRVWAMSANTYVPTLLANSSQFPELRQTETHFYDGKTYYDGDPAGTYGAKKYTYQRFVYDSYGNVTTFFDAGETGTSGDDVTATITYFADVSAYIVGKPDTIIVADAGGRQLRKRTAQYENTTGNLRTLTMHNTRGPNAVWNLSYHENGNLKTIADPVNYELTYSYDDLETATYITQIMDNFSSGDGGRYYSRARYNPLFGQMAWSRDLAGNYQINGYDDFGRLESVHGPLDTNSAEPPAGIGVPTIAMEYRAPRIAENGETLEAPARAITHNKAVSIKGSSGNILDTVTFADGMKRIIQTKKEADVNGGHSMVISGLIKFDDLGRVEYQGQPIPLSMGSSQAYEFNDLRDWPNQPLNPMLFTYDTLDRTLSTVMPDRATTTMTYDFGQAGNSGALYATTLVVDPKGNRKSSYKDVADRIMAVVEYNQGAPIITTYNYDPLGQITDVWDHKQNRTTVEYDDIGRRTAITNPDTGRTEYSYDANGNLTSKLTANYQPGKAIKYEYVFNRLMKINYPDSTDVLYEYGRMDEAYNRAGRIRKVTDESGVEERYYGRLGETVKEEKTVEAKTPPVQRKKFTTEYVFDSFGRMVEMTYPDGEKLSYTYDNGGLLFAAWGQKKGNRYDYLTSLLYDEFGQRTHIAYGNGIKTDYEYNALTRRLSKLNTVLKDGRHIQKLTYEYDLVGNVKNLKNGINVATNTALPAGPVEQNFRYDDLYQLEHGDGKYSFGPGKGNSYTNDFIYDTIGNMTKKTQVHAIHQPSMSAHLPKETNYVLDYKYTGAHPHAVTDAGDKLYAYDPAGNMTGWTHKQNGTRRLITWNEENRVKQIDDNGKSTYFLYDDAGERVVKRGQHGETIYVNRFYAVRNGELGTKQVYAGETRVLSKLVKTPNTVTANTGTVVTGTTSTIPGSQGLDNGQGKKLGIIKRLTDGATGGVNPPTEKDFFYYHGDHLGSSNMITDVNGAVYQHLEYFPFGETWIEEGGSYGGNTPGYKFTGKELDPETGLYYYGARYYDPVLSRWISADPILEKYLDGAAGGLEQPINFASYTYGRNNPIAYKDPDGNIVFLAIPLIIKGVGAAVALYGAYETGHSIGTGINQVITGEKTPGQALKEGAINVGTDVAITATGVGILKVANKVIPDSFKRKAVDKVKEGIYEFKDKVTGKPYVGQSGDIDTRLKQHVKDGRLDPSDVSSLQRTEVTGGKTTREIAEHNRIQEITGGVPARHSPDVANKVDPIGPNRQHLLE